MLVSNIFAVRKITNYFSSCLYFLMLRNEIVVPRPVNKPLFY